MFFVLIIDFIISNTIKFDTLYNPRHREDTHTPPLPPLTLHTINLAKITLMEIFVDKQIRNINKTEQDKIVLNKAKTLT